MANHASHAALPYPIKGARFTLLLPYLDADGDPTAPTTPDTEISEDNGAATDCAEEASATSGMDGMAMLTLSGAETDCSVLALNAKVASGPKATLATLFPRVLASVGTGTLSAGSAGGGTLGTLLAYDITGCFIKTTGGTGGGGTGGANNQARRIITYNTSTGAFTVEPNWETTPDSTTTYTILLPEGVTLGMLKALNPATAGRTLVVDAAGLADANAVKVGPTGSGTAQTARDLGGQLDAAVSTRSSHSAADVWAAATRTLTAATNITSTGGTTVPQTGDSYARLGAPTGASVSADLADIEGKVDDLESRLGTPSNLGSGATVAANLADIEGQTDDIGAAGAGLTAVPWNAAWDAEVQSEAADALTAYDPPTNAEMEARTLAAASYATASGVSAVETDTQDIQSRLPAALTGDGNMKADVLALNGVTASAANLEKSASVIVRGTVDSTAHTPTTTVFEADDITDSAADHYIGRVVIFTSGTLIRQATTITDYALSSGRGRFTVDALTSAPANDVTFVIV